MTIHITSGSSGWGNYVLYGTKEKPRDNDKVELIEGDIALGDRLSQSNNYEESCYKIVLSFDRKVEKETALAVYEDFKKEFFVGFKPDEYHIDTVLHTDTDYDHFHMRIPKQNLKTDTHLQLFMDKIDRPRKELIQDHLSLKYGFEIAREKNREVFKEQSNEHINKWREEHNQKPFDFKSKQEQKEAEAQINSYVSDLIKSELISSQNDIKDTLQELGLKVEKFGHDIKKDFYYATVSNDTGKIRVKGDIYKDEFFKHNAKDRTASIENNRRIEPEREPNQERAERVRRELNKANEKRFRTVTKLFKHSRERAEAEHSKTLENGRVESLNSSKHNKHNHIGVSDNSNIKSNEFKKAPKLIKREDDRGNGRAVSQISSQRAYLRPTEKSLLLQNRLKDNRNARYYEQIIERARKSREDEQRAIKRVTESRENEFRAYERLQSSIKEYGRKVSGAFATIRRKALNTINEMKEKLSFGKLKKDDNLEKLVKNMEAGTQDKSVSSSLNKIKEVQKTHMQNNDLKSYFAEKLSAKFDEVDKKAEHNQAQEPAKKRSYGRSR